MTTTGPSDAELAKQYWRKQAQHLRAQLEEANPTMKPSGGTGAKPWKAVEDAAISGASSRAFLTAFEGNGTNPNSKPVQLDPNIVIQAKATIVNALAANHTPEQIAVYLEKISPFLDTAMLAGSDPLAQSLLYAKVMSSNRQQPLGLKDVIELVGIVNQAKSQQPQSDPASMAGAMVNAVKVGIDAAKTNSSDPVQVLQMLNQNQQRAHERELSMFERLLESSQPRSLREQLTDLKDVTSTLGSLGKEPVEIQSKRLEILAQREQREFERSIEDGKERRQQKMITGIGGAIGKALESPILREAGRKMAETVPGVAKVAGVVSGVQTSAARTALNEPLQEMFGLKCSRCGADHRFTRGQLTMIESSPTQTWACPNCGESYTLKPQGGTDTMAGKSDNAGAP